MCALVGLSDATASTTPANKVSKRRKTTCTHCRQRKSKCDGVSPQCSTCIAYRTTCRYDKPPSLAYVRSLEARIEQLVREANVRVAQSGVSEDANRATTSSAFPSPTLGRNDGTVLADGIDESLEEPLNTKRDWITEVSSDGKGGVSYHNPTSSIHEAPLQHALHNPIDSAINIRTDSVSTSGSHGVRSPDSNAFNRDQTSDIKMALVSNAARQKRNEDLALNNVAMQSDISKEMGAELLNLHWCWIHPLFCIIYRPAFINDMASNSPHSPEPRYFSDTLLKIIYAHSSRFLVGSPGVNDSAPQFLEMLAEKAYLSVGMRISCPSSIPMIQGFLLLSSREVAAGRSSQAWLYSGMAFRMAIDLGIHFPSDRLQEYVKTLSVEDVEIRKRLFWSCYTWDKTISIYLGRMPAFTPPLDAENISFLDDFTDTELWEPYYGSLPRNDHNTRLPYTPVEGRVMSCFTAQCKLSVILSSVMLDIYGSASAEVDHRPSGSKTSFIKIRADLKNWWINLSPNLKLESERLGTHSQPPHIVSLNLLYHTTLILLHRPFILSGANFNSPAVQRSYQVCLEATGNIYDLLTLLVSTFGYQHISYINSYSAYIAATIAVLHYEREQEILIVEQAQNPQGQNTSSPIRQATSQSPGGYASSGSQDFSGERLGLRFFLEVMQRTARTMPAMRRSVEIVKYHMHTILERQTKRHLASLFHSHPHVDDNELSHMNFPNGNGNSNGNEHFGPWVTSQSQNGIPATQVPLSPPHSQSHSQHNGNSNNSNNTGSNGTADHYSRPVLPPMLFKTEAVTTPEDEALYSGTFYPYADEGLPAFPAQDISMQLGMGGSGGDFHSSNRMEEGVEQSARHIFRGLNLDAHLRLNHGDGEGSGGWESPGFL